MAITGFVVTTWSVWVAMWVDQVLPSIESARIAKVQRPGGTAALVGSEGDYGPGPFGRADFARLAKLLMGIKGRFILSLNDVQEIRALFAGFAMESVETLYSVAGGENTATARELIIMGPARPDALQGDLLDVTKEFGKDSSQ